MIHLPNFIDNKGKQISVDEILIEVNQDVCNLEAAGFDAILIENYFNTPFSKNRIEDYELLIMSTLVHKIKSTIKIPFGINILRNCCVQALIMATVHQASFIRCNIWEGAYVTDQGIVEGAAEKVIHKQREMKSEVKILADVHVKHASPLGNFSIEDAAKNALIRGNADAIVLSGKETGKMIAVPILQKLVEETGIKPILGSGLTIQNLKFVMPYISGAIVGSSIKEDEISSRVDFKKAEALVEEWKN